MWKLHEIKDDWGVGWQVGTVIGRDADGGDILASVPHTFTDQATAMKRSGQEFTKWRRITS